MNTAAASSLREKKRLSLLAELNARDLDVLADWMAQGKLASAIDRRYALTDAPQALAYLEAGHARAKVVIIIPGGGEAPASAREAAPPFSL